MSEQQPTPPKQQVPDPANSYERADPKHESGAGRLTNNTNATPTQRPDQMPNAVHHAQDGSRQLNADESAAEAADRDTGKTESLGWEKKSKKS